MPRNAEGPPLPRSGPTTSTTTSVRQTTGVVCQRTAGDVAERAGLFRAPVAYGIAYRPAARRSRCLVIVPDCPHCGRAHHHYGVGVRAAGCGAGRYWIAAVVQLPRAGVAS